MNNKLETTPQELFSIIGEQEFIKIKQAQELQKLYAQIEEMSKEITKLKESKGADILDMKRG